MKRVIIFSLFTVLAIQVHSQSKSFLGFGFSVTNDIFKTTDPGNYLVNVPRLGFKFDLSYTYRLTNYFLITFYALNGTILLLLIPITSSIKNTVQVRKVCAVIVTYSS